MTIRLKFWDSIKGVWPVLVNILLYVNVILWFSWLRKPILFPGKNSVILWPNRWLTLATIILLLLVPSVSYWWLRKSTGSGAAGRGRYIFLLLLLLPLSLVPLLVPSFFPLSLPSNLAVYLPVLLGSLVLLRYLRMQSQDEYRQVKTGHARLVILVAVLMSVFFWLVGWYFTETAGAHLGDEGHYLIQATSISQDLDLDLRNNFSPKETQRLLAPGGRVHFHISPYSRANQYYSWHPFGLSFFLAPFEGLGVGGRHLALGTLAGMGCAGLLLVSLCLGTPTRVALIFTLLFSFSSFWGLYACRALPETVGATATIWLFAALILHRHRPWQALVLGAVCCGLLPWFQTRFIPIAGLGGVFFLLLIWRGTITRREKWRQSAVFCLLGVIAAALFFSMQFALFVHGSPYPIKATLFSYLPGMWRVIFGWRSITYMLPMFAWLVAATAWVIRYDAENRLYGVMACALFVIVLVTSCSYSGWGGGSSPFGRYLLVVSPLLLPFGALFYRHASRAGQWLVLFLGLVSCMYFFLTLYNLGVLQRHFVDPRGNLAFLIPAFAGLANPFNTTWFGPLFYLLCFIAVWWRKGGQLPAILVGTVLLVMSGVAHKPDSIDRRNELVFVEKKQNTLVMESIDLHRAGMSARLDTSRSYRIDEIFLNRLKRYTESNIGQLTTEVLDTGVQGNRISQPGLTPNDWQERGLAWATLIPPFQYGESGKRFFCVQGGKTGTADPVLAVAELSPAAGRTALETALRPPDMEQFCRCFTFSMEALGKTYLLARLENGKGELNLTRMYWYPVDSDFIRRTGLQVPCSEP